MAKSTDKIIYLRQWVAKTIAENPDVINPTDNPTMFYAKLYEFWAKDVQVAMKSLIEMVKSK